MSQVVVESAFAGLVGQEKAKAWLGSVLSKGALTQALVFAGPQGVGRKTAAMGVAHYLHGDTSTNHPDTFVFANVLAEMRNLKKTNPVKAAVDELVKFLQMSPLQSRHKVVIIEVGPDFSDIVQNALLKTLEEISPNAAAIFIVEDESQLLPTILSRCQTVNFVALSEAEVRQIVPEASEEVIRFCEGSAKLAQDLTADPDQLESYRVMYDFWTNVQSQDIESRFRWAEKISEREEAVGFIEVGIRVWRHLVKQTPTLQLAEKITQMQLTIRQIRDNVNTRAALEALLLVF